MPVPCEKYHGPRAVCGFWSRKTPSSFKWRSRFFFFWLLRKRGIPSLHTKGKVLAFWRKQGQKKRGGAMGVALARAQHGMPRFLVTFGSATPHNNLWTLEPAFPRRRPCHHQCRHRWAAPAPPSRPLPSRRPPPPPQFPTATSLFSAMCSCAPRHGDSCVRGTAAGRRHRVRVQSSSQPRPRGYQNVVPPALLLPQSLLHHAAVVFSQ